MAKTLTDEERFFLQHVLQDCSTVVWNDVIVAQKKRHQPEYHELIVKLHEDIFKAVDMLVQGEEAK